MRLTILSHALLYSLCLLLTPAPSVAGLTRLVVTAREPTYEGAAFGAIGACEWPIVFAEGELDPCGPHNAGIVAERLEQQGEAGPHRFPVVDQQAGAGTETPSAEETAIRAARDASNRAIAAHDASALASVWMDDYHIVASTSEQRAGRDANRQAWARQFAARPDVTYVRQPIDVTVYAPWNVASEKGQWTGRWTEPDGRVEIGGEYLAQWRKVDGRWLIQAEVFVPTRCTGSTYCRQRP